MSNIKDIIDVITHLKQDMDRKSEEGKIASKIIDGLSNDDILICKFCCGFVDKTCRECPHCYGELGLFDNQTLAIKVKDFLDGKIGVIDYINEGIYIGRYSRGDKITFDIEQK